MRPIGLVSPLRRFCSGGHALVTSVSNAPGSTRFARTFGAHAPASPSVMALSPAFAIAYGRSITCGRNEPPSRR